MSYFQGRLIDHLHLRVTDYGASRDFYMAVLEVLGRSDDITYGRDWLCCDELSIGQRDYGETPSCIHLCFQAKDRAMVDQFYTAAMAAGGRDYGPPGLRDYHPGYYAAFVLDPDGNNIEVKCDERAITRSSPVIEIRT